MLIHDILTFSLSLATAFTTFTVVQLLGHASVRLLSTDSSPGHLFRRQFGGGGQTESSSVDLLNAQVVAFQGMQGRGSLKILAPTPNGC